MNTQKPDDASPISDESRFIRVQHQLRRLGIFAIFAGLCWALSQWQGAGDVQAPGWVVLRAAAIYFFILLVLRISGKRTMAETSPFDLILLLILSESIQGALIGQDDTLRTAFLAVGTFVGIDIALSLLKERSSQIDKIIDDVPVLLYSEGEFHTHHMRCERVSADDILDAARETQGLYRFDQIRYAILERNGQISIVGKKD